MVQIENGLVLNLLVYIFYQAMVQRKYIISQKKTAQSYQIKLIDLAINDENGEVFIGTDKG